MDAHDLRTAARRRVGAAPRPRRRRALTMVELLLAMAITSLVGLATAAMLRATAYATFSRQGQRTLLVRAQTIETRLAAAVRGAAEIVVPNSATPTQAEYIVLWAGDANADDVKQLAEMQLIERNTTTGVLATYSNAGAVGDFTTAAAFRTAALATYPSDGWGGGLTELSFTLVTTAADHPLLTYRLTLSEGDATQTLQGAAAPRK
jgi:hypothetical protein